MVEVEEVEVETNKHSRREQYLRMIYFVNCKEPYLVARPSSLRISTTIVDDVSYSTCLDSCVGCQTLTATPLGRQVVWCYDSACLTIY